MKTFLSTNNRRLLSLLAIPAVFFVPDATAEEAETIASFEKPDSTKNWQSVNDGVMGGRSKGGFERIERKTLLFTGDLSLENSGGFASIRTIPRPMGLEGASGIIVKARGDGRTYRVQLRTDDRMATSYRANLPTAKDVVNEYFIPFSDFKLQTFGTVVQGGKPVDPAEINSIGFSIADKIAGPFEFELESVKAFRGEIKPPLQEIADGVKTPVQNASFIKNSLTIVSYQAPLPAKLAMMSMMDGPARMLNASPTRAPKIRFNNSGSAQSVTDYVYVQRDSKITVYDAKGNEQRSFEIPSEVKFHLGFTVLPDGRMAFFDNQYDAIYFVGKDGKHLKTVAISEQPDRRMQNMDGVTVGDKLIVSENGYNELLSVDLQTYDLSVFRNLTQLEGWLGAIAYADGVYYICQSRDIYSFTSQSEDITKVATTPKGNIRRAIVVDGRLYLAVRVPQSSNDGGLYEIDPSSGEVSEVKNALSTPQGLMLLKPMER